MSDGYTPFLTPSPSPTYITIPSNTGAGTTYVVPDPNGGYTQYFPTTVNSPSGAGQVITFTPSGMQWITLTGDLSGSSSPTVVAKVRAGCSCKKCDDFNEYAEPNQKDGTFICFSCRRGF